MKAVHLRYRGRLVAAAVAGSLTLASVILAVVAFVGPQHADAPPASAANPGQERILGSQRSADTSAGTRTTPRSQSGQRRAGAPAVFGPVLSPSAPVSLDVPRIGLRNERLVRLGLAKDGSIQVPPLGPNSPAGWFRNSPTPGQLGPAVIVGHVDSATAGPAIFFRLGTLRPGDVAAVTRANHTVAVFRVVSVEKYAKSRFPALQVFGDTDHAALRLITCGGTFNTVKHRYEDNIVVYAHLVSSHPA